MTHTITTLASSWPKLSTSAIPTEEEVSSLQLAVNEEFSRANPGSDRAYISSSLLQGRKVMVVPQPKEKVRIIVLLTHTKAGDRLIIERKSKKGKFGIDLDDGSPVMVFSSRGAENVSRAIKETSNYSLLPNHPALLPLLGAASDSVKGTPAYKLVVPFKNGGDFLNRKRPIPIDQWPRLFLEVADGLSCMHDKGIAHCDIKPENLVTGDDKEGELHACVVDFAGVNFQPHLGRGSFTFSPAYAPPEYSLSSGLNSSDYRKWDVWSLGVSFVATLLRDRFPFHWQKSLQEISKRREQSFVDQEIDRVLARFPSFYQEKSIQPHLRNFLRATLTVDPTYRPSMREAMSLLKDLADAVGELDPEQRVDLEK